MIYILDNDIPPVLAKILGHLDVNATTVRDRFSPQAKDEEFLPQLKGGSWVFISGDKHIRTHPARAAALKESGVTSVFVTGKTFHNSILWDKVVWLLRHWKAIADFVAVNRPGTQGAMRQNGRVERLPV